MSLISWLRKHILPYPNIIILSPSYGDMDVKIMAAVLSSNYEFMLTCDTFYLTSESSEALSAAASFWEFWKEDPIWTTNCDLYEIARQHCVDILNHSHEMSKYIRDCNY
jgi:hypothetical protein